MVRETNLEGEQGRQGFSTVTMSCESNWLIETLILPVHAGRVRQLYTTAQLSRARGTLAVVNILSWHRTRSSSVRFCMAVLLLSVKCRYKWLSPSSAREARGERLKRTRTGEAGVQDLDGRTQRQQREAARHSRQHRSTARTQYGASVSAYNYWSCGQEMIL